MANASNDCRRIGILEMASPDRERLVYWDIFRQALGHDGFVEDRDFSLIFHWANGLSERLVAGAHEFVRAQVDIIVTAGTPAASAAINATREIPIVMATGVSVGTKLNETESRAYDNLTGISDLPPGVSERRMSLLREALSSSVTIGFLADRSNPSSPLAIRETEAAARAVGLTVKAYWIAGPEQIDAALAAMKSDGIGGFVIAPGAMFFAKRNELAASALKHSLPSMSVRREYAEAGCLMAFGSPLSENYRQAASIVGRVLSGAKPADIPIGEPTKFDFVINLATARHLGIEIPPSLRAKAELLTQ